MTQPNRNNDHSWRNAIRDGALSVLMDGQDIVAFMDWVDPEWRYYHTSADYAFDWHFQTNYWQTYEKLQEWLA
jgi:glyceraldehyde-3-phosphate dehydrogenase/erythrose-4-phosphate dehydrogenase